MSEPTLTATPPAGDGEVIVCSGGDNDRIASAALAVALFAVFASLLQLAQTIVASAKGLPNCDKRVMGLWAKHTHKRLRWLRLEVEFEAPVIFLARRDNTKGPVRDNATIWYAEGTPESCLQMRTNFPSSGGQSIDESLILVNGKGATGTGEESSAVPRERVHTVDNELASWVVLLEAIQKMEGDSRAWEATMLRDHPAGQDFEIPTLAVGIQSKTRSFEANPAVKKPYATTTICHIVELAAVLGLHWKVFNRDENKYHAEGNGYSLLGTRINDFGIVFVFEKPGWPSFRRSRVIPTSDVKELCFGNVPTFFRPKDRAEDEAWKKPATFDEQRPGMLKTLQMGSRKEIAETLHLIGCNEHTTRLYLEEKGSYSHLFPVTFEILGMLARPFHVRNRCFTHIPNPTIFPLNKTSFSVRRLLSAFNTQLSDYISTEEDQTPTPAEAAHLSTLVNDLDEALPASQGGNYVPTQLNKLHDVVDEIDAMLSRSTKDVVLDVLRRHLQEVLSDIATTSAVADVAPTPYPHVPSPAPIARADSFDTLRGAPPETREKEFINKYFTDILKRVSGVVSTDSMDAQDRQAAKASREIHQEERRQEKQRKSQEQGAAPAQAQGSATGGAEESAAGESARRPRQPPTLTTSKSGSSAGKMASMQNPSRAPTWGSAIQNEHFRVQRTVIWIAFVLRMICWLMLHDFDKKDVQLPSSELMGSRLPVYIM